MADQYASLEALARAPIRTGAAPSPALVQHMNALAEHARQNPGAVAPSTLPKRSSPKGAERTRAAGGGAAIVVSKGPVQGDHRGQNSTEAARNSGRVNAYAPSAYPHSGAPTHAGPRPAYPLNPWARSGGPSRPGPRPAPAPGLRPGPRNPPQFHASDPLYGGSLQAPTRGWPTSASPIPAGAPNAGARFSQNPGGAVMTGAAPSYAQQAARAARGRTNMRSYRPTGKRTYLPFNSTGTVAAAGNQPIQVLPQLQIRPDRLVIDATTGANFNINAITIGVVPQAAATGAVSALLFAPNQTAADMALDIANSATQITLTVANLDQTTAHAFTGALFGDEVEEG